MKSTGMTRPIDNLGRIVLPIEIRKSLDIVSGDLLDISLENDRVVLTKYLPACIFCGSSFDTFEFGGKLVCRNCVCRLSNVK